MSIDTIEAAEEAGYVAQRGQIPHSSNFRTTLVAPPGGRDAVGLGASQGAADVRALRALAGQLDGQHAPRAFTHHVNEYGELVAVL